MGTESQATAGLSERPAFVRHLLFFTAVIAIIAAAIVRSSITTSLDSFTYDEAYHIGAGVAYVKTGDFRLNPEHPPLVKLWTGAYLSLFDYEMSPYRPLSDKVDERSFVENDVYNNNDFDLIQSRARAAMLVLNGLLLLIFALAARRVFGDIIAIGATVFLAIDPTVAAHMPVVMTDLPVALTSGASILLAVHAFRTWRVADLIAASALLGLALSSKHSAVITVIAVSLIGFVMVIYASAESPVARRLRRAGSVAAVLVGAVVVLWAFYFFQYYESPATKEDQFNRPLADKISDVKTPIYRTGLTVMSDVHLFPRSYTWGLADTIRAGAEGRVGDALVWGKLYYGTGPWFFAPLMIAVKIPLGLLLLIVLGAGVIVFRRTPREFDAPVIALVVLSAVWILFVIKGSSYGGIRHLLPVYTLLSVLASVALYRAVSKRSHLQRVTTALGLAAALVLAVPLMRPWEYFNEIAGGPADAHKYFDGEGLDLYQRNNEIRTYYRNVLKPQGDVPFVFYLTPPVNDRSKIFDEVSGRDERWKGDTATGTFMIGANEMSPSFFFDKKVFRDAEPVTRFGNLFVFQGTFDIRPLRAQGLAYNAAFQIYGPEPNTEKAIEMLAESARLDPSAFFVALELGNQYLKLGKRHEALQAYEASRQFVPEGDLTADLLARQIERLKTEPVEEISPVRNPAME